MTTAAPALAWRAAKEIVANGFEALPSPDALLPVVETWISLDGVIPSAKVLMAPHRARAAAHEVVDGSSSASRIRQRRLGGRVRVARMLAWYHALGLALEDRCCRYTNRHGVQLDSMSGGGRGLRGSLRVRGETARRPAWDARLAIDAGGAPSSRHGCAR